MSNVQRVLLSEDVEDVIERIGENEALCVLESAAEITRREQREMTLEEALAVVRKVAAQVEEIG